jgi:hypothetical protein
MNNLNFMHEYQDTLVGYQDRNEVINQYLGAPEPLLNYIPYEIAIDQMNRRQVLNELPESTTPTNTGTTTSYGPNTGTTTSYSNNAADNQVTAAAAKAIADAKAQVTAAKARIALQDATDAAKAAAARGAVADARAKAIADAKAQAASAKARMDFNEATAKAKATVARGAVAAARAKALAAVEAEVKAATAKAEARAAARNHLNEAVTRALDEVARVAALAAKIARDEANKAAAEAAAYTEDADAAADAAGAESPVIPSTGTETPSIPSTGPETPDSKPLEEIILEINLERTSLLYRLDVLRHYYDNRVVMRVEEANGNPSTIDVIIHTNFPKKELRIEDLQYIRSLSRRKDLAEPPEHEPDEIDRKMSIIVTNPFQDSWANDAASPYNKLVAIYSPHNFASYSYGPGGRTYTFNLTQIKKRNVHHYKTLYFAHGLQTSNITFDAVYEYSPDRSSNMYSDSYWRYAYLKFSIPMVDIP